MMNTHYYNFGNPFKVKFRKHYCYICGSKLSNTRIRSSPSKFSIALLLFFLIISVTEPRH